MKLVIYVSHILFLLGSVLFQNTIVKVDYETELVASLDHEVNKDILCLALFDKLKAITDAIDDEGPISDECSEHYDQITTLKEIVIARSLPDEDHPNE